MSDFTEKLITVAREDVQPSGAAPESRPIQSSPTTQKVWEESDENPLKKPWKVAVACLLVAISTGLAGNITRKRQASAADRESRNVRQRNDGR